ncbi:MAG TPA: DUF2934 domain-containing protein [Bryobacteraceae bacterium]|nr:DUF2934 domain-containing protein [Bryobacteraceae bacterium]
MPGKSAVKKATPATETAPAKKSPRVSTAKHRTKKLQEPQAVVEATADNSRDVIASIAYGYWESRGRHGGNALEDWLRAEKEYFAAKAAAATA